jgi:hypothetical protein
MYNDIADKVQFAIMTGVKQELGAGSLGHRA